MTRYSTPTIDTAEAADLATVEAEACAAEAKARELEEQVRNGDRGVTVAAIRDAEDGRRLAGLRLEAVQRQYAQQRTTAAAARAQEVRDDAAGVLGAQNAALLAAQRKVREGVAEMAAAIAAGNADITRVLTDLEPVRDEAAALGVEAVSNGYGKPPALQVDDLRGAAHDTPLAVYATVLDGLPPHLQEHPATASAPTAAREIHEGRRRVGWGVPALPPVESVQVAGYYDAAYGVWRDSSGRELGADGKPVTA